MYQFQEKERSKYKGKRNQDSLYLFKAIVPRKQENIHRRTASSIIIKMRYSVLTLAAVTSLWPNLAVGLAGLDWSVADTPPEGLKDITFPMKIAEADHEEGYYYAQQYDFEGTGMGYTGIQPVPDADGKSQLRVIFSSFTAGTTTDHENCSDGADGGEGVSCKLMINANYDDTFSLEIRNTEGTTWSGTIVSKETGAESHIGTYTLPGESGGITGGQVGFVEYYPWNGMPSHECSEIIKTSIIFGNPTTETDGAGEGSVGEGYENGDCVGEAGFKTQQTSEGTQITVGFI